ncbi:MAG: Alcohol dehydrogenase zinc-binding domain protein [Mucilaginibacter sp.]|nr:Alcohol dehydrogenase zinc-binding domain protein [Mucilaginibacter sp.]
MPGSEIQELANFIFMKAIRLHERGGAEKLIWEEASMPVLRQGDAMVKVLASAITRNELTWPNTYTDENGRSRLPTIPGHELCGIVTAVAPDVTGVRPDDTVYGLTSFFRGGTAAEYVAVRAADLAPKPETLDAYQAAAVPLAALTAWQSLFDHGGLKSGQRVLIHGAAGGVGSLAIQLAHWCGAEVIAATSASNLSLVCDLGAHQAVDYNAAPFEDQVKDIDVVFDTIGQDIQHRSWQVLKAGGILVTIAGESITFPTDVKDKRGVIFIVRSDKRQLVKIGQLIDQHIMRPVIAEIIPIDQAREAFEKLDGRAGRGKIILKI